jgi:Domain of unknown function (DUF4404)
MLSEDGRRYLHDMEFLATPPEASETGEFLKLLAGLRTEIGDLARTKSDEAHRIATITRDSTEAATHDQTNPELVKQSLDQLASAVSGFEESHPRLVEVVNRMATMLAGSGV